MSLDNEISVNRKVYNEINFSHEYSIKPLKLDSLFVSSRKYSIKYLKPSGGCAINFLLNRFPIVNLFQTYKFSYFLNDLIGGITIGAIQIAPTMANSVMANLPPINGLYVAFFSVLCYVIFGTSRHLSLGTQGAISLMVGSIIRKYEGVLYPYEDNNVLKKSEMTTIRNKSLILMSGSGDVLNESFIAMDPLQAKIIISMSLAFLVGIIQIILSFLNGGLLTKYLSNVVIDAFTIGASFIVVISQLSSLFGYSVRDKDLGIPFKIINTLFCTFKFITMANLATCFISLIAIVSLVSVKIFINERYKKHLKIAIPIELIVIILATLFSHIWNFEKRWSVSIVGKLPLGLPTPRLPLFSIFKYLLGDAFTLAVVSYALNISVAKHFSKKYKYPINPNQEFLAYGIGNLVTSLFEGYPSSAGITRSLLMEATGAKTQVFSIISSIIVLIVIVGLGFLFQSLPHSCLSAIIVTSLMFKCIEVKKIVSLFKKSKSEALVWIVTLCSTVLLDVSFGLYFGIGVSLLVLIIQNQRSHTAVLGNIRHTELYEDIKRCANALEFNNIKIIRYESPIHYANCDNFVSKIIKLTGINPNEIINEIYKEREECNRRINKLKANGVEKFMKMILNKNREEIKRMDIYRVTDRERNNVDDFERQLAKQIDEEERLEWNRLNSKIEFYLNKIKIKHVIIDFSCVNHLDSMAIENLIDLNKIFKEVQVTIHLTGITSTVSRILRKFSFETEFDYAFIYPSIHDAVSFIMSIST